MERCHLLPEIVVKVSRYPAPFLFLCVALGIFPFFLMDWMEASIAQWVATMGG